MGPSNGFWASLTVLSVAVTVAVAAAVDSSAATAAAAAAAVAVTSADDDVVYDQRQNGTENVRISLSDLKVVLAPADGLFPIMYMAGEQFLGSKLGGNSAFEHKPTGGDCTGFKCGSNNRHRQAAKKNRFRLSSLIAPLLSQVEQKTAEIESNGSNDKHFN